MDLFLANPTYYYKSFQIYSGLYIRVLINVSIQRNDDNGKLFTDHSFFATVETVKRIIVSRKLELK